MNLTPERPPVLDKVVEWFNDFFNFNMYRGSGIGINS